MAGTATILFTDLKGSTALRDTLGHASFQAILNEHLSAGMALSQVFGGRYVKNIGDAHMIEFSDPTKAVAFAAALQEFSVDQPCFVGLGLEVKIGLYHGLVDAEALGDTVDAMGQGVERAARIQALAQPGQVLVGDTVAGFLRDAWGGEAADYLASMGQQELKGVQEPVEVFVFDWQEFVARHPQETQAGLVMNHLTRAGFKRVSLSAQDLASPGVCIWPIVPRNVITAIHRGQCEAARLLASLGWRIRVVIADCGSKRPYDPAFVHAFSAKLQAHLTFRRLDQVEIVLLSDMFSPKSPSYVDLMNQLQHITSTLDFSELLEMNNKDYSDEVKDEIRKAPALNFMRPALIVSATIQSAIDGGCKVIALAGADEQVQWKRAINMDGARDLLGVLMNPILRDNEDNSLVQAAQTLDGPIWESPEDLASALESGNLAYWVFALHVLLPRYPAESVDMGAGVTLGPVDWVSEFENPATLDFARLAAKAWEILDPSV